MTTFNTEDKICIFKQKNEILSKISNQIIELHRLANEIPDSGIGFKVRLVADQLARVGNEYNEMSTL